MVDGARSPTAPPPTCVVRLASPHSQHGGPGRPRCARFAPTWRLTCLAYEAPFPATPDLRPVRPTASPVRNRRPFRARTPPLRPDAVRVRLSGGVTYQGAS